MLQKEGLLKEQTIFKNSYEDFPKQLSIVAGGHLLAINLLVGS